jgi:hypothetical protein
VKRGDAFAHLDHLSCDVAPQDRGQFERHDGAQIPAAQLQIERVDARALHPYLHFAGCRLRLGQLRHAKLIRIAVVGEQDCFHGDTST